jgi:hypothetical protein
VTIRSVRNRWLILRLCGGRLGLSVSHPCGNDTEDDRNGHIPAEFDGFLLWIIQSPGRPFLNRGPTISYYFRSTPARAWMSNERRAHSVHSPKPWLGVKVCRIRLLIKTTTDQGP